jgi:hypothetical protein
MNVPVDRIRTLRRPNKGEPKMSLERLSWRIAPLIFAALGGNLAIAAAPVEMRQLDVSQLKEVLSKQKCPSVDPPLIKVPPQHEVCGGDGTRGPCGEGREFDEVCWRKSRTCIDQYVEDQRVINKYNQWISKNCYSQKRPSSAQIDIPFVPKPPSLPSEESLLPNSAMYNCHQDTKTCFQACVKAQETRLAVCEEECSKSDDQNGTAKANYCFGRAK